VVASKQFFPVSALSLRDQVVAQIRDAIIEGRLRPRDRIPEITIAEQLGVSRTPVREALVILEHEGLVVATVNRGFCVRAFSALDVEHIFAMRILFENYAAELNIERLNHQDFVALEDLIEQQRIATIQGNFAQVRRIDMSFHRYLVAHSLQPLLLRNWTELVAQIAALLSLRAKSVAYNELLAIADHTRIIEAYKRRSLAEVLLENREINRRVCSECVAATRIERQ